jgi:hypothetical protein
VLTSRRLKTRTDSGPEDSEPTRLVSTVCDPAATGEPLPGRFVVRRSDPGVRPARKSATIDLDRGPALLTRGSPGCPP